MELFLVGCFFALRGFYIFMFLVVFIYIYNNIYYVCYSSILFVAHLLTTFLIRAHLQSEEYRSFQESSFMYVWQEIID